MRALVSSGFSEGHAFPALALSRELLARGHEVHVALSERWREPIGDLGARFVEVAEYEPFPAAHPSPPPRTVTEAAWELREAISALGADVVVADFASPAATLAAELAGVRCATLIPTLYPASSLGLPPFGLGRRPPRTSAGRAFWRAADPLTRPLRRGARWTARAADLLDDTRRELGLPAAPRVRDRMTTYGPIGPGPALVATFPQLEPPRRWPAGVEVTGPMLFELPHREVELPAGEQPLVVVATSTVADPGFELVRTAISGLAAEPVRVVASLNRRGAGWDGPTAPNATVVDWLSYAQALPAAALVISNGGQGTVVRALAEGVPLLVCAGGADTAENGARVEWAGAGRLLRRWRDPADLGRAARAILADRRYAARAGELAAWAHDHDGAARGAELVERYARTRRE